MPGFIELQYAQMCANVMLPSVCWFLSPLSNVHMEWLYCGHGTVVSCDASGAMYLRECMCLSWKILSVSFHVSVFLSNASNTVLCQKRTFLQAPAWLSSATCWRWFM